MSGFHRNTLPLVHLNFQSQLGTNYNLAFAFCLLSLRPILYVICRNSSAMK